MPGANPIRNVGRFCEAKRFFVDYLGLHAQVIEQLYGIHRTSKPCHFRKRERERESHVRGVYVDIYIYTHAYEDVHMHVKQVLETPNPLKQCRAEVATDIMVLDSLYHEGIKYFK